jgi:hypothetical protein
MRRRALPLGADTNRPPDRLRRFDPRDWLDDWPAASRLDVDEHNRRVVAARLRHDAACAAWTQATGQLVHRPARGETWPRYWHRVGPPPPGTLAMMRARLAAAVH